MLYRRPNTPSVGVWPSNSSGVRGELISRSLESLTLNKLHLTIFIFLRVEVSLASALVNFGWITPGRLTPLIRPLMDTIRVTSTTFTSSLPPTDLDIDLPRTGENMRLQRLAAWNLARLLWSECRQLPSSTASTSKALSKVTQNLAKYILPDDIPDWGKCPDRSGHCDRVLFSNYPLMPFRQFDYQGNG